MSVVGSAIRNSMPYSFIANLMKKAGEAYSGQSRLLKKGLWWNPYKGRVKSYRNRSLTDRSTNNRGLSRRNLMKCGYNHIRCNGE